MTVRIALYDTTLRDGAQTEGISFSLNDKLALTKRLDELGFDYVEGGYPASNEKDKAYFERVGEPSNAPKTAVVCAFGMTRRKGLAPADDAGLQKLVESSASVLTIVGKSSAYQAREVVRVSLDENLAMVDETIRFARNAGKRVFYDAEHFFDGWKGDAEYALETLRVAARAGAEAVVLCDTNGGSFPEEIAAGTRAAVDAVRGIGEKTVVVGIHPHNDCGLATANALAAVESGATLVQGTIDGVGERCGNADLITIAAILALKKNGRFSVLRSESIKRLTEFSRYFCELANVRPDPARPFVGKSAFAHKGGMHVAAINRSSASYEHVPPEAVGNERRVLVSELSGRSNLVAYAKKFRLEENGTLDRETISKLLDEIARKESAGYQYEAADGSLKLLAQKIKGEFKPSFRRLNYQTSVIATAVNEALTAKSTLATVKLRVGEAGVGETRLEVAEGDGPVDALNNALRKALEPIYPELREMKLVDYKVRVLNSDAATAATTRVIVESKDGDERWGTVGVSENVVEASWIALCDSIEYKLAKSFASRRAEN